MCVDTLQVIKNLGFTLTRNTCSNMHIQIICCKALKLLGFINRVSNSFLLLAPLNALFCSLVRLILEYGTVLWDPSAASVCDMIERAQRKFLRHAALKLNVPCPPHDYIRRLISLKSFANRRHSANLSFLSNLLSSKIDSPESLCFVQHPQPPYTINCSILYSILILNTYPSFSLLNLSPVSIKLFIIVIFLSK